jgi:outer membrane protein
MAGFALLALLALGPAAPAATLTLAEAVATAARVHPTLVAADAQRDAAKARVGEQLAGFLPTLNANGLGRVDYADYPLVIPGTPGSPAMRGTTSFAGTSRYSGSLTLQQTVWDFGRTLYAVKGAKEALAGSRADAATARATVELNVINAYYGVLQAIALKQVADDALAQSEQHLNQANAGFRVGTRPEIDVASAESQRAQARLALIHARNAIDLGKVTLNGAMGVEGGIGFDVREQPMPPVEGEDSDIDSLTGEALRRRPEYESLTHQLRAAEAALRAARAAHLPILNAGGAATATGTDSAPGPYFDFSAQLTLTVPLFAGLLTYRTVQENEALVRAARANLEALRQTVRLGVATAALAVGEAREAVEAAEVLRQQAEKQLKLATGRYQAGVGSIIELVDAQAGAVSARAQRVQAEYNLASSRAALLRALGRPIEPQR